MTASSVLFGALQPLIPLCVLSLLYVYLYPALHGCAFPVPEYAAGAHGCSSNASVTDGSIGIGGLQQQAANAAACLPPAAQFRLLAFGDPQLEGDSSLPGLNQDGKGLFPSLASLREQDGSLWNLRTLTAVGRELFTEDIPRLLEYGKKSVDLWGNDLYLAHIYRTIDWWTEPTHLVVLGDLLGSQWVKDDEFDRRSDRLWKTVFKGTAKVPEAVMGMGSNGDATEQSEILGAEDAWRKRVIAVAGNHDIGYAGDLDEPRIERFERRFGKVNWSVRFSLPPPDFDQDNGQEAENAQGLPPTLRLIVLNSMNLDTPALSSNLQSQTYDFLNSVINTQPPLPSVQDEPDKTATVILTHIPLHKRPGICADAPYFDFFSGIYGDGVKEQNHLSDYASRVGILEGMFGMSGNEQAPARGFGRRGIVLTGHDHVGCDVWHFWNQTPSTSQDWENGAGEAGEDKESARWDAVSWMAASELVESNNAALNPSISEQSREYATPGLREVTVRSMMGEFGGNAGLLSGWYDDNLQRWRFEYSSCSLGVQHIWWAVHVLTIVTLFIVLLAFVSLFVERRASKAKGSVRKEKARISNGNLAGNKVAPTEKPKKELTERKETDR